MHLFLELVIKNHAGRDHLETVPYMEERKWAMMIEIEQMWIAFRWLKGH
jgi:hypothetical protein